MLAACSNENEVGNSSPVELNLTSGLTVQQAGTRATTDLQGSQFDKDAQVSVYINEAIQKGQTATTTYAQPLTYTANGTGGLTTAPQQYFPTSGNGVNIYAVYPTTAKAGTVFTVQTDQSTDANYKKSDLMYGKPTQNNPVARQNEAVNLNFTHLFSKVTVELKSENGSPKLDGATVTLKSVKPSTTLTANATSGTISESSGEAGDIKVMTVANNALTGSAIVVPQTLATSFIEVTLADGGVLTSDNLTDKDGNPIDTVVLEGSKEYKYTITVNLTGLNISSSITPWGIVENSGNASMQ